MIKTKIVFKHRKRLTESDRDFIKKFIDTYFGIAKDIQDFYIEERSPVD